MLSPDPYIQMQDYTQNFNRYSYCFNNPLKYTDPSGKFVFVPILMGMVYGAFIGAGTGAIAYLIGAAISGNWDWNDFGKSVAFGAVGGAISGGISAFAPALGSSANNIGYNILSQTSSNIMTNAIFGNDVTVGGIAGSIVGGLIGSCMPKFNGVNGGWLKNAIAETGFSVFKGGYTGAFSGAISGIIDDNPDGMMQGLMGGMISGGAGSIFRIGALGATITNGDLNKKYGSQKYIDMMDCLVGYKDDGGVYLRRWLWSVGGINIGRNLTIHDSDNKDYAITDFILHERGHLYQQSQVGFARFYARYLFEYLTIKDTYTNKSTLDWQADEWAFQTSGFNYTIGH